MVGLCSHGCQCFIETYTGGLAKVSINKHYQEKYERFNMEEWENIFTLLQWVDDWYIDHDQYDTMNEWNTLIYREKHSIINKINEAVNFP